MAEFPILSSGARVQYPIRRSHGPVRTSVEFWGGSVQSYQRRKSPPLSWTVKYVGLTEAETSLLLEFCERYAADGLFFSFRDPITGILYDQCIVEPSSISAGSTGVSAYEFRAIVRRMEE